MRVCVCVCMNMYKIKLVGQMREIRENVGKNDFSMSPPPNT